MDIEKILATIAKQLKLSFVLKNKNISIEEVFSANGLLPAFAKRANHLSSFCLNEELGVNFSNSSDAIMGMTVAFKFKQANSFVLLCFLDVLVQIIKSQGKVEQYVLDDLLLD